MHPRQRPMALAPFLVLLTLCLHGQAVAEDRAPRGSIHTTMHAFFQALTSVFPWSLDAQQFQVFHGRPSSPRHHFSRKRRFA